MWLIRKKKNDISTDFLRGGGGKNCFHFSKSNSSLYWFSCEGKWVYNKIIDILGRKWWSKISQGKSFQKMATTRKLNQQDDVLNLLELPLIWIWYSLIKHFLANRLGRNMLLQSCLVFRGIQIWFVGSEPWIKIRAWTVRSGPWFKTWAWAVGNKTRLNAWTWLFCWFGSRVLQRRWNTLAPSCQESWLWWRGEKEVFWFQVF